MKKVLLFSVLLSLVSPADKAQILFKLANDTMQAFNYSGGDEFNQNELDLNYWDDGLGWTRVLMSQDLAFSPKNISLKDGLVKFAAKKEDSVYTLGPWEIDSALLKKGKVDFKDNKFLTKYSAGLIVSKKKLHYGLYELRFKVEEGRGIWPAFWFQGGYKNEEIDAFELKGEQNNKVSVDTHCPHGCDNGYSDKFSFSRNWGGWLPLNDYLHKGFNIMLLEWETDHVNFFVNGYPLAYYYGHFPNPLNVFINTSVAKDGGPFKPGPDPSTTWPNTYSVDYFRTWKKAGPKDILILNTNTNCLLSNEFITTYSIKPTRKYGLTYKKILNREEGFISIVRSGPNKLLINVLGDLNNAKTKLSLICLLSGKEIFLTPGGKELEIELDPREKVLELKILHDKKNYSRKFILSE